MMSASATTKIRMRLKDAYENLMERIGANPGTFVRAIGGNKRSSALFVLLKFVKMQLERGNNPEVEVDPAEIVAEARKIYERLSGKTGTEHWVLKL